MSRKITFKPNNKNCNIITRFYQYSSRLQILRFLSTRWKYQHYAPREQLLSSFPTRENINIMHQGNSFSALSPQEKISILCTKGTASQLFPHKRKYQYYAPREQLLSSFPTRENINIMHQGNSFSALSPQEKISILCTKGTASQLFPNKNKLF